MKLMLKTIEAGATIDASFFKSQQKEQRTIKERLLRRLTGGCIFTLMGVIFTILCFINRNTPSETPVSSDSFTAPCILGGIFFATGITKAVSACPVCGGMNH